MRALLDCHLALVSNSGLNENSFEKMQRQSHELYFDILGNVRPWEGADYTARKGNEFKRGRQAYIDAFGVDPLDPGFRAWEAQRITDIEAGKFDVAIVNDEADLRERMQAQAQKKGRRR